MGVPVDVKNHEVMAFLENHSIRQAMKEFGVGYGTVYRIKTGQRKRYVIEKIKPKTEIDPSARLCSCCGREPVMAGNLRLGERCYKRNPFFRRDTIITEVGA